MGPHQSAVIYKGSEPDTEDILTVSAATSTLNAKSAAADDSVLTTPMLTAATTSNCPHYVPSYAFSFRTALGPE